jgi:DNA-directed RNA polymerase specialized sigma24 family protein
MDVQELMRIAAHCAKAYGRRLRLQRDDVEDVRQDVLVKMLHALRTHDPDNVPLRPFLFMVAYRRAKESATRLMNRRRQERQLVAGHLRPVRERPRLDDADEVEFLMRSLTPTQRETVEACVLGGQARRGYSVASGRVPHAAREAIKFAIRRMRHKAAHARGAARC